MSLSVQTDRPQAVPAVEKSDSSSPTLEKTAMSSSEKFGGATMGLEEPFTPLSSVSTASIDTTVSGESTPLPEVGTFDFTITKAEEDFRNYKNSKRHAIVENHYRQMRTNQTLDFVRRMHEKFSFERPRARMTIREAFRVLEQYVDSSDPDASLPNMYHMLQSAESARKAGAPDWLQLTLLVHDMGKMLFLFSDTPEQDGMKGTAEGPQWALGGDTWIVGCRIPDGVVFPEFNTLNPDMQDPILSTENGIYQPHCGLDNCLFAYGHDEYMYQMLKANNARLPSDAMAMIRYHSAYPWHRSGAYKHLMVPEDEDKLKAVLWFNAYDLYSKSDTDLPDVEELWPYYQGLIDKFLGPEPLMW